jgi:methionine-rich copper-binding protein CopC
MKKLFSLIVVLVSLTHPNLVFSHAVVTNYSLKISPIHVGQPDKVTLTFNSQIELGLSQVFLVRKGDVHELLVVSKGKKQGDIIVDIPALDSGEYALSFKIFAADGHLTEDVIHFTVAPQNTHVIQDTSR